MKHLTFSFFCRSVSFEAKNTEPLILWMTSITYFRIFTFHYILWLHSKHISYYLFKNIKDLYKSLNILIYYFLLSHTQRERERERERESWIWSRYTKVFLFEATLFIRRCIIYIVTQLYILFFVQIGKKKI